MSSNTVFRHEFERTLGALPPTRQLCHITFLVATGPAAGRTAASGNESSRRTPTIASPALDLRDGLRVSYDRNRSFPPGRALRPYQRVFHVERERRRFQGRRGYRKQGETGEATMDRYRVK